MAYQVFISFKNEWEGKPTRDSEIAHELYDELKKYGIEVFFGQEEVQRKGRSDYGDLINEALEEAGILILVGTRKEFINSRWVKYEWDLFNNEIYSGHKDGKIITVLEGMDVGELPIGMRRWQSYDLKKFDTQHIAITIMNVLMGVNGDVICKNKGKDISIQDNLEKYDNNKQLLCISYRSEESDIREKQRKIRAYEGDEPFIFISYAHEDSECVYSIINKLENDGCRIWYDGGIDYTKNYVGEINEKIEQCAVLAVFVTEASMKSENVIEECAYAIALKKEMLIIWLEDVPREYVNPSLRGKFTISQGCNWYKESDDEKEYKLKKALNAHNVFGC